MITQHFYLKLCNLIDNNKNTIKMVLTLKCKKYTRFITEQSKM